MGHPARYESVPDWEALPSHQIAANGIELKVTELGDGPQVVILAHGFPELGFSWRHQVFPLAAAGYRVLVPDLRGYGGSSRPPEVESYDIAALSADLIGLLDAVGAEQGVLVGHDWGANIVWNTSLAYPDRVRAVAGLSVPASPRPPAPPVAIFRQRLGEDFYIVWFQEPGVADPVLNRNVPAVLLADDLRARSWADGAGPGSGPAELAAKRPWLAEEEFAVLVRAFEETGFTGGLNYYRNIDRNWELEATFPTATIDCPSLFIAGSNDMVATYMPARRLPDVLTDLRGHVVVDGGHWIQQERPGQVTRALLDFLRSL